MSNKKIFDTITKKEPITKGWSEDKKYCVTTTDGTKYLLRISLLSQFEIKKLLFSMMEQIASPLFATGQLHGYFDGEPPMKFLNCLLFISQFLYCH